MDKLSKREAIVAAAGLAAVLFIGTAGYMMLEGWNLLDSAYMTVITLATIGYGETHPLSDTGRLFTLLLILGGIGIVAYSFSMMTALLVGGHITDAFRRKKMRSDIKSLKGHYIICGGGRAPLAIAAELQRTGRHFVLLEKTPEVCRELEEKGWLALCSDATDDKLLEAAGLPHAAGLFLCLPNDKDNTYLALSARLLAPDLRIVSAHNAPETATKLLRSGVDTLVNPGFISGMRMVSEMVRPATVGFLDSMLRDSSSDCRFEDVLAGPSCKHTLAELHSPGKPDWPMIVGLKTAEGKYEINPDGNRQILPGESLVAIGTQAQIASLKHKLSH